MIRATQLAVLALALLVACSAPAPAPTAVPPTEPAGPTAAPSPTTAQVPTAAPTASVPVVEARGLCNAVAGSACAVDGGRYADPRFEPTIAFEIGDGWQNVEVVRDSIVFERVVGQKQISFLEINARQTRFYDDDLNLVAIDPTPDALLRLLRNRSSLVVEEPVELTVGGLPAVQVDILSTPATERLFSYRDGSGYYALDDGRRVRVISILVGREQLLILAEAPIGSFDDLWNEARVVVESLELVTIR